LSRRADDILVSAGGRRADSARAEAESGLCQAGALDSGAGGSSAQAVWLERRRRRRTATTTARRRRKKKKTQKGV